MTGSLHVYSQLVFLLVTDLVFAHETDFSSYTISLGGSSTNDAENSPYSFSWSVSSNREWLKFEACLKKERTVRLRLFGIGFGLLDSGPVEMNAYMLYFPAIRAPSAPESWFLEGYTDQHGVFLERAEDSHSAYQVELNLDNPKQVCLGFSRRAISCVKKGYTIDDQTTRLFLFHDYRNASDMWLQNDYDQPYLYSTNPRDYYALQFEENNVDQLPINLSKTNYRLVHLQLIKSSQNLTEDSIKGASTFEMRVKNVLIPDADTTYWCKTSTLPHFDRKQHIIRYEPVISPTSEGLVHHMEVFLCSGSRPVPSYNAPCNSETKPMGLTDCRNVIGAWAMGATGLTFPEETGIAIGGPGSSSQVVIEIHYNNPNLLAGHVDNSGIRFYITDKLRPYDAGVMELGLVYSARSAIPPGQMRFSLSGYCHSQCTEVSLPPKGIVVFGSQLHTHSTGVKVVTYHMRGRRRLHDLNRDDHYSPHFQEIRLIKEQAHVKRGDSLITQCTHDTSRKDHVIFGGLSKTNEMCLNYIFYYPKTDLELCKSEVSQPELDEFLRRVAEEQTGKPVQIGTLEERFNAIQWDDDTAAALTKFYDHATIEMHCNNSRGTRIEGSAIHLKPIHVPSRSILKSIVNKLKCLVPDQ